MKKTLLLSGVLMFAMSTQCFAAPQTPCGIPTVKVNSDQQAPVELKQKPKRPDAMEKRKADFEKRLKLTDEQKVQAKAIREKTHEQMRPIMEKIRAKHQEIRMIRMSRMAVEMQDEKIAAIKVELKELNKQARELRQQNMKEFEAILTPKQQKELKKMKAEGRKNFEKNFKKKHNCKYGCDKKTPFTPEGAHRPQIEPPVSPGPDVAPQTPVLNK